MKIIAVFGDDPLQRALASKISTVAPIAHIARVRVAQKPRAILPRIIPAVAGLPLRKAWFALKDQFHQQFPIWQGTTSTYPSANAPELINLIQRERPDLILVSGTDLIKRATIESFGSKIMNLHTGISPYIRGGPNCTNWALALGEFDLIGNTVMWIDAGIDSGAIIATERTPLTGRESLAELHLMVMEHAHDLYSRVVAAYVGGRTFPGVSQASIDQGRLFLTKHWTAKQSVRAILNHRFRYRSFRLRPGIKLVSLSGRSASSRR